MITATRSTESKKAPEAPSKPAEAPRAAAVRADKPGEPARPAPRVADKAEVSPEAASGEGVGEDDMMERVRARVAQARGGSAGGEDDRSVDPGFKLAGDDRPVAGGGVKTLGEASAAAGAAVGAAGQKSDPPTPEEQALNNLDQYGDIYDNPGNADDPDGIISEGDLEDIASGDYDREEARAYLESRGVSEEDIDETLMSIEESAGFLRENDDLRNELDTGNDPGGDTDGDISRGDVSAVVFDRQLEKARNGELEGGPSASNRDDYEEVETMDERTPEVIQQQEAAVLEAVTSGQPVEFTNANGETEMLSISQVDDSGDNAVYEITGADGHTIRISSELGASENRAALARLADYYSQLPPGVRDSVDSIELLRHADDSAAADFHRDGDKVRFFDGLTNLNEEVFNHEYGHGVGYESDDDGEGFFDDVGGLFGGQDGQGAPNGWEDAISSDGDAPSGYSDTNYKEDFAESWAAYLEARENGPEALAQLMEAYPARFEILEQIYEQAA